MSYTKTPMIKTCQHCGGEFRPFTFYCGKRIRLYKRKYCYDCVPYEPHGKNRFLSKTKNTLDGKRQCVICVEFKPIEEFSRTNKRGNLNSYCRPCATIKTNKSKHCFKKECVEYKGGKCIRCGYDKCPGAIEFHHRDSTQKDFKISGSRTVLLTEEIKKELDKCDILCSNCHKELHYTGEY